VVLARLEDRGVDQLAGAVGEVLLRRVQLVESLDEGQVRELLHHPERIGDTS